MKKYPSTFYNVFAVYIIAGILAIVLFYKDGSHLSHRMDQQPATESDLETAMTTPNTEPVSKDVTVVGTVETRDDAATETENSSEADQAVATEPEDTSSETDAEPENASSTTDAEPENTLSEDDTEPEKVYYGFTVKPDRTSVRVRETSARNSAIVTHVNGGDTGYVIKEEGNRTQVVLADGTVGYIYNEYIELSEIAKEDVPEEYR